MVFSSVVARRGEREGPVDVSRFDRWKRASSVPAKAPRAKGFGASPATAPTVGLDIADNFRQPCLSTDKTEGPLARALL
jgi:hypothetical protein